MTNKEKIKQSLTFQDIKHNYFKHGYLTDAEVEWLIERIDETKELLPMVIPKDRIFHEKLLALRNKLDA